ncbi:uncharacterized protein LOC131951398 [Physella acuta]|uniref:uncharacterized protein LOC131951398 n=1 Tax=Physella acuta TaxID=109671 RepID=UPI0027DD0F69|nr:uncharacterized protein LOC131951398 [Physella acuta]
MFKFVVAVTLCYFIAEYRCIEQDDGCGALFACHFPNSWYRIRNNADFNRFCQENENLSSCIDNTKNQCGSQSTVTAVLKEIAGNRRVCTNETRADVLTVNSCSCLNAANENKTRQAVRDCSSDYSVQFMAVMEAAIVGHYRPNTCGLVSGLYNCIYNNYTQRCGDRVGGLLSRAWQAANNYRFSHCGLQIGNARNSG